MILRPHPTEGQTSSLPAMLDAHCVLYNFNFNFSPATQPSVNH